MTEERFDFYKSAEFTNYGRGTPAVCLFQKELYYINVKKAKSCEIRVNDIIIKQKVY